MRLSQIFEKLLQKKDLSFAESKAVFEQLFKNQLPEQKAKALLLLLAKKGESVSEVLGCLESLKRLEPSSKKIRGLIDTCGTGGDNSHSLNISTLAALVIAGAGGKVAKHGNRGMSSLCGSSDVLEALGLKLEAKPASILKSIQKNGMGYFHAPAHHPVFSKIQPLRKQLKIKTIFNLLGPLINPARPDFQLIGVSSEKNFDRYVAILKALKATALVCHSAEGLDEISPSSVTKIGILEKGRVRLGEIHPERFGIMKSSLKKIRGGHAKKNAKAALDLLKGKDHGPLRDMVSLNAAAGLLIAGIAKSFAHGLSLAYESLDSGRAMEVLKGMVKTQC